MNRAALITGGSSGIGLAIARALGQDGYRLTISARRPDKLEAAAEELRADGLDVEAVPANMADEEEIRKLVAAHRERCGRLDVLINNAGIGIGGAVADAETKKLDLQLDVNLRAVYLLAREAIPMLKEAGAEHGKALMVNTASYAGKHGQGWLAAYSATKFGVVGLSQALHKELLEGRRAGDRALPRLRRDPDDRLGRGSGAEGRDDPAGGHRRGDPVPAQDVAKLRGSGASVRPSGRL